MEVGTLSELNVQPGDVVELMASHIKSPYAGRHFTIRQDGCPEFYNEYYRKLDHYDANSRHTWRIVSRATPAKIEDITWGPWGEFDPSRSLTDDVLWRQVNGERQWSYPVPKQPVVETVRLLTAEFYGWRAEREGQCGRHNTHRITLTIIDGVVQPTATVEAI